jgi:hypothetical protein
MVLNDLDLLENTTQGKVPNLHIGAKSFHLDRGGVVRWNDGDRSDWSLYCDEHHETVNDLTSNNMVRQLDLTTNQSDRGMIV